MTAMGRMDGKIAFTTGAATPDELAETVEEEVEALGRRAVSGGRSILEASDVANAVLFLACAESRYITGAALPVDLGMSQKYSGA